MKGLKLILFLAWRNVLKYKRRNLQTFWILFAGSLCVMAIDSFMRGFEASMIETIVASSGHADAHARGYLDAIEGEPLDLAIGDAEGVERLMLAAALKSVRGARKGSDLAGAIPIAAASIGFGALLSDGEKSVPVRALATEFRALGTGSGRERTNPLVAEAFDAIGGITSPRGALLETGAAGKLGLTALSSVILLCTDATGSFAMAELPVLGLVDESRMPEGAACLIDLASAQEALGMERGASAVSLWFLGGADGMCLLPRAAKEAGEEVARAAQGAGLEGRSFEGISSSYSAMISFLDGFLAAMMAVFCLVAIVGMTNAMLLSVKDRTRDLGTLRAIALTRKGAGGLVAAETALVGIAAALASLAAGSVLVFVLWKTGLGFMFDFSDVATLMPDSIRPIFRFPRLLGIAGLSAILPLVAALLPIRSATRLAIREALARGREPPSVSEGEGGYPALAEIRRCLPSSSLSINGLFPRVDRVSNRIAT